MQVRDARNDRATSFRRSLKHRQPQNRKQSPAKSTYFLFPPFTAFTGLRCPLPLIGSNLWPSHDGMLQSEIETAAKKVTPAQRICRTVWFALKRARRGICSLADPVKQEASVRLGVGVF